MREGGDVSRGRSERTHLPAIIFALRIIIASPSSGVSVMALGVGALTISALHAFNHAAFPALRTALNEQLDWRLDDLDLRLLGPALHEFGLDKSVFL